jgi:hypothetical protein
MLLDRCEVGIAINEQGCQRTLHSRNECTATDVGSNGKHLCANRRDDPACRACESRPLAACLTSRFSISRQYADA